MRSIVSRMSIKSVKYSNEPVYVNSDGTLEPYIHQDIVTHRDAYAKSLHMLFNHVGEFHILLVEILSEKTGLDSSDIIKQIQTDERFKEMYTMPTVHSMNFVQKNDIEKIIPVVEDLTQKMGAVAIEDSPKKRKYVRKVTKP
jgi:mevalonate pyrophosphate decarboxylase